MCSEEQAIIERFIFTNDAYRFASSAKSLGFEIGVSISGPGGYTQEMPANPEDIRHNGTLAAAEVYLITVLLPSEERLRVLDMPIAKICYFFKLMAKCAILR